MSINAEEIRRRFWPHQMAKEQHNHTRTIRQLAEALALSICDTTPECRERVLALTQLEQATMWAVAAIARPKSSR